MDLFITLMVIFGLSFGTVAAVAIGIVAVCAGFGSPYDRNAPVQKATVSVELDAFGHKQPNYAGIFGTLLVLTVVTVILSRIDLGGAGNTSLAMLVATFKASLVALYFMHLKDERRLMFSVILIPMFFFAALFFGLMPDLVTNNYSDETHERMGFGPGKTESQLLAGEIKR